MWMFVDFRVPQVAPPRNDADADDDDEPTTAMPHSHRQANTHRDQISRSGETPHSDIGNKYPPPTTNNNKENDFASSYPHLEMGHWG